jgi:hypothetical protein
MKTLFGILFILTGIFALFGGLYTWGAGSIFEQSELSEVLIPWADMLLTGPLSLLSGYGILRERSWGRKLGLVTSGVYLFGSTLVWIRIVWNQDYSPSLIIPSALGFLIALGFILYTLKP